MNYFMGFSIAVAMSAAACGSGEFAADSTSFGRAASELAPPGSGLVVQSQAVSFLGAPRASFGAATALGRLFIVGGHTGKEHRYKPESFLATTQVYDPVAREWHIVAPRPVAAEGFMLVAHGQFLYAFGGFAHDGTRTPSYQSLDVIDRYDTRADRWETIGHMPRHVSSNAVIPIGNRAYLFGGWDATPTADGRPFGDFVTDIDVFDFETETMSTLAVKLPKARRAMAGCAWNGKAVLLGGIGPDFSSPLFNDVTVFDPETSEWSELAPLSAPTLSPVAGVSGGRLFAIGGYQQGGADGFSGYAKTVDMLESPSGQWVRTASQLQKGAGFSAIAKLPGDALAVLGGQTNEGGNGPLTSFDTFQFVVDPPGL